MGLTSNFYGNSLYNKEAIDHARKKRGKKAKKRQGDNRPSWMSVKSGSVTTYTPSAFYQSREWLDLRYKALQKYGAKCHCCGRSRHDNVIIHVDHIKPRSTFPELELNLDNLQILCNECNIGKSNRDHTDWR